MFKLMTMMMIMVQMMTEVVGERVLLLARETYQKQIQIQLFQRMVLVITVMNPLIKFNEYFPQTLLHIYAKL